MSTKSLEACLAVVLAQEGGWSDDPRDPGGATMKGVTQAVYDAYCTLHNRPGGSVFYISDADMQAIYRQQYWTPIQGDRLLAGLDLAVMDYAVNSGVSRAAKALQRYVGAKQDGFIGLLTLHEMLEFDTTALIAGVCDLRLTYLQGLGTFPTFGKGWTARVAAVRGAALKMAGG